MKRESRRARSSAPARHQKGTTHNGTGRHELARDGTVTSTKTRLTTRVPRASAMTRKSSASGSGCRFWWASAFPALLVVGSEARGRLDLVGGERRVAVRANQLWVGVVIA